MSESVPSEAELERLTALALYAAREAGRLAARGWRQRPQVRAKRPKDLVTEFDLASERRLRELLAAETPDIAFVGEEEGGEAGSGLAWHCDPLDGTTNFVHGHPFWCVSVGLMLGRRPLLGAVVAPALAAEWHGWVSGGAWRIGEPCHVSDTLRLEDSLVATGFPPDRSDSRTNNLRSFERAKQLVQAVRRCGSAALDLCLVADGTYDAYWERPLHSWDTAAGAALVLSAGGRVTALDGGPVDLSVGHLVASNGHVHDALVGLVLDHRS